MIKKSLCVLLCITIISMLFPISAIAQTSLTSQTSTNYAAGKPYTFSGQYQSNFGNPNTIVTDGNKYSSTYVTVYGSPSSIKIDLKGTYTIDKIKVWHYWADGRTYHNTKTEVSEDGLNWTSIFDSAVSGEYKETEHGKIHTFNTLKVRYIRDWINGSNVNNGNQWVEIQAFGPGQVGNDVKQNLPFNDGLESTSGVAGLPQGTVSLTQDKVSGTYAVKVAVGDNPNDNYFSYKLTTSTPFEISKYSQIKIWVKPGAGAKWIRFWNVYDSNILGFVKNDKDGDGLFKVGEDLVSGKWNLVTLDLTRTSNPSMVEGKELWVHTNEFSTWFYDDITSVYAPVSSIDTSKMFNNQTQLVNGGLQFKPNGTTTYNTTPTVLVSENDNNTAKSMFSRASVAYNNDGIQVASGVPRYKTGKFGNGVWVEEATTNIDTDGSFESGVLPAITSSSDGGSGIYAISSPAGAWHGSKTFRCTDTVGSHEIRFFPQVINSSVVTCTVRIRRTNASNAWAGTLRNGKSAGIYVRLFDETAGVRVADIILVSQDSVPVAWTTYSKTISITSGRTYSWAIVFDPYVGEYLPEIDGLMRETKSYATSFTGTTRNADQLYYTLAQALPKRVFGCLFWKPDQGSANKNTSSVIYSTKDAVGAEKYSVVYEKPAGVFAFYKNAAAYTLATPVITFNAGDNIFVAWADDPVTGNMKLWIGINGGAITEYTLVNSVQVTDAQKVYVGDNANGYIANGIIDALQIIDIDALEASGTTFNSTFVNNQYTAVSAPTLSPAHLLLSNYESTVDSLGSYYNNTPVLPDGKISGIFIDSSYATSSGPLNGLPSQRLYFSGVLPTKLALSGDGKRLFFMNSTALYLFDFNTGENRHIAVGYYPTSDIKVNFDGTKVTFKDTNSKLYLYDDSTKITTHISDGVSAFAMQRDGTVSYYKTNLTIYRYTPSSAAPGEVILSGQAASYLDIAKVGNKLFYGVNNQLYSLTLTPTGWKAKLLTTTSKNIEELWTNIDGTLVYLKTADGFFSYQLSSKAIRKLDITAITIVKVTDDNKLIARDENDHYQIYDPNTDMSKDIRPTNALNNYSFDVDSSGNKMAYVSTNGLSTYYFNGVQRPERYLLSFDGKNSWYSYKNGVWSVVKTGSVPVAADFDKYGMTIDEVNALDEGDFESLYQNGRQILHLDVAVYFASVDPYITPSLKGITATIKGTGSSGGAPGDTLLEKALYAKKQQDFNATTWRQIKKIYPVELLPKEAEIYYFVYTDRGNYSFKNKQWTAVDSQLLTNMEANWITISQQGITAEDLKAIPEDSLNSVLPTDNFSIVYAMKVQDLSTEGYISLITVDYVESQFVSNNLVLKLTLTDGTVKQYPNLTKTEVEDFMNWLNERQYNRGPIFYCIKTGSTTPGVVQVNGYINYYMIQSVDVEEMTYA